MKISSILPAVLLCSAAFAGSQTEEKAPTPKEIELSNAMRFAIYGQTNMEKIEALIRAGVDLNQPIACGTFGVLDAVAGKQDADLLKFFLAHGAKPKGRELVASMNTPFTETAEILLNAGVSPNVKSDGIPAIHTAAYRSGTEYLHLLLVRPGILVDATDNEGETALMKAVRAGSMKNAEMLLNAGANPMLKNKAGLSAADILKQSIDERGLLLAKLNAPPVIAKTDAPKPARP